MPKRFENSVEDRAHFSDRLLAFLTQPYCVLRNLREKRGQISKDLGIRCVVFYTISCRVLSRISHVSCPLKQGKAVRRLRLMLTGGVIKKKKRLNSSGSSRRTRDRAVSYIEKCICSYLAGDPETALGRNFHDNNLRSEFLRGDGVLFDVLGVLEKSPTLRHIMPVSVVSLVCVFVELLMFGKLQGLGDVECDGIEDLQRDDVYFALEKASQSLLERFHSCSGVVGGGDGRPLVSPSSVFERDGEISKLAVSNVALVGAISVGSRMKKPTSARVDSSSSEKVSVDNFFALIMDAVLGRAEDEQEFDAVMDEAEETLSRDLKESLVSQRYLKPFFKVYETLQKCNRISVQTYAGPGVVCNSRHIPDAVRYRLKERSNEAYFYGLMLEEIDDDIRDFRTIKNSSMDTERVYVRKDGNKVVRYGFGSSADLCKLLFNTVRLAESYVRDAELRDKKSSVVERCASVKSNLERDFMLGLFCCDLSGNVTNLYEDYIYSFAMRHFDEEEGVSGSLKAATKRRNAVSKRKTRHGDRAVVEGAVLPAEDSGGFAPVEEDWGITEDE